MKKKIVLIGIVLVAIGFLSSGLGLEIIAPGLVDDTMVTQISPDRVWGSSPDIRVYAVGEDVIYTYIKHDVHIGGNIEINWATLSFFASHYNGGTFSVHRVTEQWDEGVMTWNTKADYDPIAVATYGQEWISNPIHITITDAVVDWVNGEPNYGLVLIPTEGCNLALYAKENTTTGGAVLTIEYDYQGNDEVVVIDNNELVTEDTSTNEEIPPTAITEEKEDSGIGLIGWILIILGVILIIYGFVRR